MKDKNIHVINTITVQFKDQQQEVDFETTSSGITEAPYRLWLDLSCGRLYIMMDSIKSYMVS